MIRLDHLATYNSCSAFSDLFTSRISTGTLCLSDWEKDLKALANSNKPYLRTPYDRNKILGDAFEQLTELFFGWYSTVGTVRGSYEPVHLHEDYGVDAEAVNDNGHRVAIQVKFRSDPSNNDLFPSYADIARTDCSARHQLGIDTSKKASIFLVTNTYDVSHNCSLVLGNALVVFKRKDIECINNNHTFWSFAAGEVQQYLTNTPHTVPLQEFSNYII